MRTILYLIRKEFIQIFRNKFISKAIFAVPIVQMLILVPAVTFELKTARIAIIDHDMTPASRAIKNRLEGSSFFRVEAQAFSEKQALELMHRNKISLILEIPEGFARDVMNGRQGQVMVSADAVNSSAAQIAWTYITGVLRDYSLDLVEERSGAAITLPSLVQAGNRFWYNESLNYKYFMLPGILVVLVTAVGFLLAGLNMVREKEIGTIEQINVTPVRKYQFIVAKMVPFLAIGLLDLALGLAIGKLAFSIPFEGNLLLMFFAASIFLVSVLSLALFISTFSGSQQQFMFIAFFFMIIFILMSGIFTPIESMPAWARYFDLVNPVAWLIRINRMIMLKGSGLSDISTEILSLIAIAAGFLVLAIGKYRKTSA